LTLYGGTIDGGKIDGGPGFSVTGETSGTLDGVTFSGALELSAADSALTLDGVTFHGMLGITAADSSVTLEDGIVMTGAAGTGSGSILLTGAGSQIYLAGSQTLNGATLTLGADTVYVESVGTAAATVTLGSRFAVVDALTAGTSAAILASTGTESLITQGSITAQSSGGSFYINGFASFTNDGSLTATNGDRLAISAAALTNLVGTTLDGGHWEADSGSVLELLSAAPIVTDAAVIVLYGAGSVIETYDAATSTYETLDQTLTTIAAGGELSIRHARDFTASGAFKNAGEMHLGGGVFTTTRLTDFKGSTLDGFGTLDGAFANDGSVNVDGGTFTFDDAVVGTGRMTIDAASGIDVADRIAAGQSIGFAGTGGALLIGDATYFDASISGFAATDTIDLTGFRYAKSETVGYVPNSGSTGGTLSVTDGSRVANLTLFGQYVAAGFSLAKDGGGTAISYTPPATSKLQLAAGR
jgi:hypothetical protein